MQTLRPVPTRASMVATNGRWAVCRDVSLYWQSRDVMGVIPFEFAQTDRFGRARILQSPTARVNGEFQMLYRTFFAV